MCDTDKIKDYLKKPLTLEEANSIADEDGNIKVVISISFYQLIDGIEALNDLVEEMIVQDCCLYDIQYRPVGITENNDILIEVSTGIYELG
jgi:hypothetical protein